MLGQHLQIQPVRGDDDFRLQGLDLGQGFDPTVPRLMVTVDESGVHVVVGDVTDDDSGEAGYVNYQPLAVERAQLRATASDRT